MEKDLGSCWKNSQFLAGDDDAFERTQPLCKGFFVSCAQSIGFVFGDDLEAEVFGPGHGIDFGCVDHGGHVDDFGGRILLQTEINT